MTKIAVIVHPNSKKPRIIKNDLGNIEVYVAQKPIDNQANEAVLVALAKYFQVKKSALQLVSGSKSKKKIFEILEVSRH